MNNKFSYHYLFSGLLITEVLIAFFVRDEFIRPYFGDYLATIVVYTFVRAFFKLSVHRSLIFSVLFSYAVEFLQAVNLLAIIRQDKNKVVSVIAGNAFDWGDILAYTLAGVSILLFEQKITKHKLS